jgi:hypothetical protein
MSIPFRLAKKECLGLDDVLTFGKYHGLTVLQIIQERNGYIDYLISKGIKVYPSVQQELKRQPFVFPNKPAYPRKRAYFDGYSKDDYDHDLLGDYFDDVPF